MSISNSIHTGVSALRSFARGIEVIGDNISNIATAGFKKGRADYSDSFSDLLHSPQGGGNGTPHRNASSVGSGVRVAQVSVNFATEDAQYTGVSSDLAINGAGFFRVQEPGSGQEFFTRAGNFRLDNSGYLVTPGSFRLMGADGLLQVPATVATENGSQAVTGWGFSSETGTLKLELADGSTVDGGQVSLARFVEPGALVRAGGNLYQGSDAAGRLANFTAGTGTAAIIQSGYLELSNVDLTEEFAGMITTQRGFQAGARIISTADQLMQEAIQLKR